MDNGMGTPLRSGPAVFTAASGLTASPGSASPVLQTGRERQPEPETEPSGSPLSGLCVFSGGTAANSLVDAFQAVASHMSGRGGVTCAAPSVAASPGQPCSLTYIIPISDNGGSSSELIRFFGGPSVGDIRSRLVRLIPTRDDDAAKAPDASTSSTTNERAALRALFEHRLCSSDPNQARIEWLDVVEARHLLWTFVPSATRELVRAVLNTLNLEIVKRARPSTSVFDFAGASVGNLFLTGARLFSGSFEAAIYLLSLLCGIPDHVAVLPSINSNFTHHISAGLLDGTTIAGQVNISHPSAPTALPDGTPAAQDMHNMHSMQGTQSVQRMAAPTAAAVAQTAISSSSSHSSRPGGRRERASTAVDFEDATLPGSLPVLRQPQIAFSKEDEEDLPARIARIWYINPYGHEIRPQANPKTLAALQQAEAIVYSIGSLYTSIVPSLVLRGIGAAIETHHRGNPRRKILILNSTLDRETGPRGDPMTAADFVRAIVGACKQSQSDFGSVQDGECPRYVTHLVYLENLEDDDVTAAGPAGPRVDKTELGRLGVQCVGVPSQAAQMRLSRTTPRPGTEEVDKKARERYDEASLTRTLKGLVDGSWAGEV